MPNMSYCRFQNTVGDLQDCSEHLFDKLDKDEELARKRLVAICRDIYEAWEEGPEEDDDDEETENGS